MTYPANAVHSEKIGALDPSLWICLYALVTIKLIVTCMAVTLKQALQLDWSISHYFAEQTIIEVQECH
jgi:hypothetical protein